MKKLTAKLGVFCAAFLAAMSLASPAQASHSDAIVQSVRAQVQWAYSAGYVTDRNYQSFQAVYPTWAAAVAQAFPHNGNSGGGRPGGIGEVEF